MIRVNWRALPVATCVASVASPRAAHAAPTKLIVHSQLGWKINTNESNFCLESECRPAGAEANTNPGGFGNASEFGGVSPDGVAVAPNGNLYVTDSSNQRVQELTPTGEFVLMFGKGVNKKGGSICTKAEESECQAGTIGGEAGAFDRPESVAVDPVTKNVYVEEYDPPHDRVQEFTAAGVFVLMLGKEVNETTKGNICTQVEIEGGAKCKVGLQASGEHGAFNFRGGSAGLLAAGGPEDLLYVGDEHLVQEFKPDGTWVHDLPLTSISSESGSQVGSIAVDQASGDVYLTYYGTFAEQLSSTIFEFDTSDKEVHRCTLAARQSASSMTVEAIALDPAPVGLLAVTEAEETGPFAERSEHGSLVQWSTCRRMTDITALEGANPHNGGVYNNVPSLVFDAGGDLYGAFPGRRGVVNYEPKTVAELVTGAMGCKQEGEAEALVTFGCVLNGEANPEGVSETEVWFQWGRTLALGEETPLQPIKNVKEPPVPGEEEPSVPVEASIGVLRPGETIFYRLVGVDQWVRLPELLAGEAVVATTPVVPPRIVGPPSALFVRSFSAVMFGELNPENTKTEYLFEYAPGEVALASRCPNGIVVERSHCEVEGVASTPAQESAEYGKLATTLEARGLQPSTSYRYRLFAVNEKGEAARDATGGLPVLEGEFKTAPAPVPQALTGVFSAVTTTRAVVSGTVNPGGQPAVYTFELGVYKGASTRYGVVVSASAGSGAVPVEETLQLSGLQPGTTYAYRIVLSSAYGTSYGATITFATEGLAEVIPAPITLEMLPTPPIKFPKAANKPLTNAQKLANALKACKHKPKRQRTNCERNAHKKYKPKPKKKK